jgi:hypothetical protein
LSVRVIGPNAEQIAELRRKWRESLPTEAPFELAAFLDRNVLNLASIVLVVARGRKRVLLPGDARGDHIMRGLQDAGVLTGATAHFDVLKVPHHGSDRNVTADFFRRLPADHYIVSGNGKHGNPETATLNMLAEGRGAARPSRRPPAIRSRRRSRSARRARCWWNSGTRSSERTLASEERSAYPYGGWECRCRQRAIRDLSRTGHSRGYRIHVDASARPDRPWAPRTTSTRLA